MAIRVEMFFNLKLLFKKETYFMLHTKMDLSFAST